ncbi:hypothetical protein VPH35_043138 [Triticum aestivum]
MVKGRTGQRVRLYVRGTILGFKRSKSNQYESTSLVQVEGVNTKEDVAWYGVAATEEASSASLCSPRDDTHYRCLWGKITRPHGNSGIVRAQFKSNLPAESMTISFMIHLYMLLLYESLYLDVLCMTEVCEMQCFSVVVCLMGIDAQKIESGCNCFDIPVWPPGMLMKYNEVSSSDYFTNGCIFTSHKTPDM